MDGGKEAIKAFVLCAGLGTRLRPITDHIPKPLIPLLGRPLLDHILERLKALQPEAIGVNIHHLPEKMFAYCKQKTNIRVFWEREILGTGGALKNAESFLSGGTFIVHNGDVLAEIDFFKALNFHRETGAIATLLVCNIPWANNLVIDRDGRLVTVLSTDNQGLPSSGVTRVGFTGIAFYEEEFLKYLTSGYSSVVEGWIRAMSAGEKILTYPIEGPWFDLGTPERYLRALFYLLKKEGENLFVHPLAEIEDLKLKGFVSIETETKVRHPAYLSNVIVLAERETISGSYQNGILLGSQFIQIAEREIPFLEERGFPVGFGGSGRKFYRLLDSKILMVDPERDNVERTVTINRLLRKRGIRLPDILEVSGEEVIFKDLGDLSLYNYIKIIQKNRETLKKIFSEVLDEVIKLHTLPLDSEVTETFPLFDYDHFRWETEYFEEKFLNFFCGLEAEDRLIEEFVKLAEISSSFPRNLIHRDLQSQNILIYDGKIYLIDYQGARIGPPGYDFASLIYDPYWEQDDDFRKWALDYYVERRSLADPSFEKELFFKSLPYLTLQRHLQALSAFVNLSFFKGKSHFYKFIPRCFRYLQRDVEALKGEFPALWSSLQKCAQILEKRGVILSA